MTTGDDELTSRAQGRIGTVLRGKYRIDRVLGAGGMAVVYKATHRNEAEFAVKMLHPELSIRDDVRTRFLREGRAANSVKHPGVVVVVDDDVAEDGAAFLVMELLSGAAVETLWERGGCRLPLRAVVAIGDQLLDVLAAAHEKGIVHRDIKPPNLFVTKDGTLKVLDFGIARVKDTAGSGSGQQTGTGMLLGTPAFMAPEQAYAKASEIDGQTDVWAAGATLFTLLAGQPVHKGENAAQLMIHAATKPARALASLVSDVPPAIAQVIDQALMFEKASRWPSSAAMQEALARASVEALGDRPSKSVLAALVNGSGGEDVGIGATQMAPINVVTPARTDGVVPVVIAGTARSGVVRTSTSPVVGGSTAQPVSSEPLPSLPVQRGPGGRKGAIAVIALLMLGGGALAVRTVSGGKQEPSAAAAGLGSTVPPAPSPPPSTEAANPIPAVTVNAPAPATALPSAPVQASKPSAPVQHVSTSPKPPPVASTSSSTPSPPAKPAADCDPPYFYDATGGKHYKPACFTH